ncbi:MAG: type IV pilus assembly protein PilM [Nitrospirae bacterium]|nr:MAG: type IV pilus assembly protein PilM [Nitrospirota bacterium]
MAVYASVKQVIGWLGLTSFLVGLDIGSQNIKLVQLAHGSANFSLQHWGIVKLPSPHAASVPLFTRSIQQEALQTLLKETPYRARRAAVAVSGTSVMAKRVRLPGMPVDQIRQYLYEEGQQYVPDALDEVYLDYHILSPSLTPSSEQSLEILLVAARRDVVDARCQIVKEAGFIPTVCDMEGLALANMYTVMYGPQPGAVMLVEMGARHITICVLENGVPWVLQDSSVMEGRGCDMTKRATEQDFRETGSSCEMQDHAECSALGQMVAGEISRMQYYLAEHRPSLALTRILLCGGYALVPKVLDTVAKRVSCPVELANPFRRVTLPRKAQDELLSLAPLFTLAVGLALRKIDEP